MNEKEVHNLIKISDVYDTVFGIKGYSDIHGNLKSLDIKNNYGFPQIISMPVENFKEDYVLLVNNKGYPPRLYFVDVKDKSYYDFIFNAHTWPIIEKCATYKGNIENISLLESWYYLELTPGKVCV